MYARVIVRYLYVELKPNAYRADQVCRPAYFSSKTTEQILIDFAIKVFA
jgi:hypothetical protein